MSYPYEDLDDAQFERLVVQCCRKLFGAGVQAFAAGPDGGRDARFDGIAERFPSSAGPWTGVTVIQAKHTNSTNSHYSDASFSGSSGSSVLSEEIVRVRKLVDSGEVRNYIVFANRRLGATSAPAIMDRLAVETGLERSLIFLAGVEYLDDMLHEHKDLIALSRIDPVEGPLLVSSYEIAEVVLAIAEELNALKANSDAPVVDRVSYTKKNQLNNMSSEFAALLSKRYMLYTKQIESFLADPGNAAALRNYESAVDDFQLKIVAKRGAYHLFDDVFNHLVDLLISRDGVLSRNRPLLRAMIFYMYWHCDIGRSVDVVA